MNRAVNSLVLFRCIDYQYRRLMNFEIISITIIVIFIVLERYGGGCLEVFS